jgi:hypothetical protein
MRLLPLEAAFHIEIALGPVAVEQPDPSEPAHTAFQILEFVPEMPFPFESTFHDESM